MLTNIKTYLIVTALTVFGALAVLSLAPTSVSAASDADIDGSLCQGAQLEFGSDKEQCKTPDAQNKVNDLIATIINIFSVVVGVVAVIMIIIGGFRYITSGGDSGNVTGAKNTILYAVIGLIIVALAQFVVKFVLEQTTKQV